SELIVLLDCAPRSVLYARQHEIRQRPALECGRPFNQALLFRRDPGLKAFCSGPASGYSCRCIGHRSSPAPMYGQLPAISSLVTRLMGRVGSFSQFMRKAVLLNSNILAFVPNT